MSSLQLNFDHYYVNKYKNTQLLWLTTHGQLTLETTYLAKSY